MHWLITTDGSDRAQSAAVFAAGLLQADEDEVTLLGIAQKGQEVEIQRALDETAALIPGGVRERILRYGSTADGIESAIQSQPYDLVVYGSRGRRGLTKMLFGSVAARLAHEIDCSVLIVRTPPEPVERVLVCTTLDARHLAPIRLGGELAHRCGAQITLMHVMSQITMADNAPAEQLMLSAGEAIRKRTREGLAFAQALDLLSARGVTAQTLIRHGLVIDEIMDEVVSGKYDLLVIGAHTAPRDSVWQDLLVEDITNTILLQTRCPVLIVREQPVKVRRAVFE